MNRAVGFTLAEVLITLGIIGVVAAMTIPTIASRVTHKRLQAQFKKTYSDLNRAARTFYADTDSSVHDYDLIADHKEDSASRNDATLKKFMSYYNGFSVSDQNNWTKFDKQYKINNLNMKGYISTGAYPCDESRVYLDDVGRLYTMDDTVRVYKNFDFGPKICVDINGIDRPNRWGYDRFVFVFTSQNAVVPYTGKEYWTLSKNLFDKNEIAQYCNKTQSHACAYFALLDEAPDGKGSYWYNYLK